MRLPLLLLLLPLLLCFACVALPRPHTAPHTPHAVTDSYTCSGWQTNRSTHIAHTYRGLWGNCCCYCCGWVLYVMAWAIGKSRTFRPRVLLCVLVWQLCDIICCFFSPLFYWLIFGHEIWSN